MEKRESVKLKEKTESAKQRPMGQQQIPWLCIALLATDSCLVSLQRTPKHR